MNKINEEIKNMDPEIPIKEENWQEKYIRLYADMENMKKRSLKEKMDVVNLTKVKMIDPILDIHNDIFIASKSVDLPDGMKLILQKLDNFLKSQGIEEVPCEEYNEGIHEVISISPGISGMEVISKGYKMGDNIIRYPKVIISKNE